VPFKLCGFCIEKFLYYQCPRTNTAHYGPQSPSHDALTARAVAIEHNPVVRERVQQSPNAGDSALPALTLKSIPAPAKVPEPDFMTVTRGSAGSYRNRVVQGLPKYPCTSEATQGRLLFR